MFKHVRKAVIATSVAVAATMSFADNSITIEQIAADDLAHAQSLVSSALSELDSSAVADAVATITAIAITEDGELRVVEVSSLSITTDGNVEWDGLIETTEATEEIVGYVFDVSGVQAVIDTHYFFDHSIGTLHEGEPDAHRGAIGDRISSVVYLIEDLEAAVQQANISQDWALIDGAATRITEDISSINSEIQTVRNAYAAVNGLEGGDIAQ